MIVRLAIAYAVVLLAVAAPGLMLATVAIAKTCREIKTREDGAVSNAGICRERGL